MEDNHTLIYQRKTVDTLKPIRDEKGNIRYTDALLYLVRVVPIRHPDFKIILSLASYTTQNEGLSVKQAEIADRLINYHESINPGIFNNPSKKSRRF